MRYPCLYSSHPSLPAQGIIYHRFVFRSRCPIKATPVQTNVLQTVRTEKLSFQLSYYVFSVKQWKKAETAGIITGRGYGLLFLKCYYILNCALPRGTARWRVAGERTGGRPTPLQGPPPLPTAGAHLASPPVCFLHITGTFPLPMDGKRDVIRGI